MPCSQHCAAQRQALRKLPLLASMCFILHSEYLLHTWIQTLGSVGAHARLLRGGPDSQNVFCVASGCTHLGEPPQAGPGVAARLRCSAPVRGAGANVVGGGRAVMSVSLCACACPEACSGASTREYEPCAPSRAGIAPCQRRRTPVCIPLSAPAHLWRGAHAPRAHWPSAGRRWAGHAACRAAAATPAGSAHAERAERPPAMHLAGGPRAPAGRGACLRGVGAAARPRPRRRTPAARRAGWRPARRPPRPAGRPWTRPGPPPSARA